MGTALSISSLPRVIVRCCILTVINRLAKPFPIFLFVCRKLQGKTPGFWLAVSPRALMIGCAMHEGRFLSGEVPGTTVPSVSGIFS